MGVNLCGVSHPAVYTKAIAGMLIVNPIIATAFNGNVPGVLLESAMPASSEMCELTDLRAIHLGLRKGSATIS
jgi:hypothetical protein